MTDDTMTQRKPGPDAHPEPAAEAWCPAGHAVQVQFTGRDDRQRLFVLHRDERGGCCFWSGAPPPRGFDPANPAGGG